MKDNYEIIKPCLKFNFSNKKIIFVINFNYQIELINMCKNLRDKYQCFILTLNKKILVKHFKNFNLIKYPNNLEKLLKLINYITIMYYNL